MTETDDGRPLGVSWYVIERWLSGKGIRDASKDTVLERQLTPELSQRFGLQRAEDASLLPDASLSALCGELDIGIGYGYGGRRAQLEALRAPITSTADVHRHIITPHCHAAGRRSIAESLRGTMVTETLWNKLVPAVGPATCFVSHVWTCDLDETLSALDEHMCTVPLHERDQQYFFLDILCINPYDSQTFGSEGWSHVFERSVGAIGHTLLVAIPALAPAALHRSWCLWELLCTLQTGSSLTVATSQREHGTLANLHDYPAAIAALAAIDSERAQATYARDKARIDACILAAGGYGRIDQAVRGRLLAELLSRALERGSDHFPLVRSLCDAGAALETECGTYRSAALAMAANPRSGLLERRRLREAGRLEEMRARDAEVVAYLLQRGADPNAQSSKTGDTALSCACRYGDRPTVLLLLDARADPNIAQTGLNAGETAFLTAARWGASNCLRDLAAAGADVNALAYSNYLERVGGAAMWKNTYRSVEHLRLLHDVGCDLTYINSEGTSAATLAAEDGCVESLRFLLDEVGALDVGGKLRAQLARLEQGVADPWSSSPLQRYYP